MSSSFRLLMTTDVVSEVWNYTSALCRALLQHGNIDILLVSFGGKPSQTHIEESQKSNFNVKYSDFPIETKYNSLFEWPSPEEIKKYLKNIIKEFNPDFIHLNHYMDDTFKTPTVLTVHSDMLSWLKWVKNKGRSLNYTDNLLKYKLSIYQMLNKVDAVITTSRSIAENILDIYDFRNRIKIIHNGIDGNPHFNPPDKPSIVSKGDFVDKSKNLHLLTGIATKLPDNINIKVIGQGPERKFKNRIEYLDKLTHEETLDVYRNSSIFLALSSYETFGLSMIEAAYSNCAIIANDIPIFRELWGDSASIFRRDDLNSFIRALNNLIENEDLLKVTAKNCQTKALSTFSSKRMAFEYLNFYKFILQKNASFLKNR